MLHFRMGSTNTVNVISPGMTIFLYAANPWAIELKFDQIRSIVNNVSMMSAEFTYILFLNINISAIILPYIMSFVPLPFEN